MAGENETVKIRKGKIITTCRNAVGAVYCLGFIGAAVYYIQHATDFWNGVLGILKALVWPAILVYKALELLTL